MANKENEPPQGKKRRLSLSLKKSNDKVEENIGSRWNFIGEEEQSSLATNHIFHKNGFIEFYGMENVSKRNIL